MVVKEIRLCDVCGETALVAADVTYLDGSGDRANADLCADHWGDIYIRMQPATPTDADSFSTYSREDD
jgi:hypothetical protein